MKKKSYGNVIECCQQLLLKMLICWSFCSDQRLSRRANTSALKSPRYTTHVMPLSPELHHLQNLTSFSFGGRRRHNCWCGAAHGRDKAFTPLITAERRAAVMATGGGPAEKKCNHQNQSTCISYIPFVSPFHFHKNCGDIIYNTVSSGSLQ